MDRWGEESFVGTVSAVQVRRWGVDDSGGLESDAQERSDVCGFWLMMTTSALTDSQGGNTATTAPVWRLPARTNDWSGFRTFLSQFSLQNYRLSQDETLQNHLEWEQTSDVGGHLRDGLIRW